MDELWKNKIFAIHITAAAGSMALGTAVTYPFDTIKVLVQVYIIELFFLIFFGSLMFTGVYLFIFLQRTGKL